MDAWLILCFPRFEAEGCPASRARILSRKCWSDGCCLTRATDSGCIGATCRARPTLLCRVARSSSSSTAPSSISTRHLHQGCRYVKMPATRADFWKAKLKANVECDRRAVGKLQALGWRVLCVWECSTRDAEAAAGLQDALYRWIEGGSQFGEISDVTLAWDGRAP